MSDFKNLSHHYRGAGVYFYAGLVSHFGPGTQNSLVLVTFVQWIATFDIEPSIKTIKGVEYHQTSGGLCFR